MRYQEIIVGENPVYLDIDPEPGLAEVVSFVREYGDPASFQVHGITVDGEEVHLGPYVDSMRTVVVYADPERFKALRVSGEKGSRIVARFQEVQPRGEVLDQTPVAVQVDDPTPPTILEQVRIAMAAVMAERTGGLDPQEDDPWDFGEDVDDDDDSDDLLTPYEFAELKDEFPIDHDAELLAGEPGQAEPEPAQAPETPDPVPNPSPGPESPSDAV